MINALIEAISVALGDEFGERCKIHMEEIGQGMEEPCFLIECQESESRLFLGKRYFRTNQFCIRYFPEDRAHTKRECHEVGERLLSCLEWLEVGNDLMMGTKMKYDVIDDILHFFVNYDGFFYRQGSEPVMETVSSETFVRR